MRSSSFVTALVTVSLITCPRPAPAEGGGALAALEAALSDRSPDVRRFARAAIEKIGRQRATSDDVAGEFTSLALGQKWTFTVERTALERAPLWLDSEEAPPLPPRQAIAAARAQLAKHVPAAKEWRPTSVRLLPLVGPGRWIYLIGLDEAPPTEGFRPMPLEMVVLMDGTAVEPVISPIPPARR